MHAVAGEVGKRPTPATVEPQSWELFGVKAGCVRVCHAAGPMKDGLEYVSSDADDLPATVDRRGGLPRQVHGPAPHSGSIGLSSTIDRVPGPIQFIRRLLEFWQLPEEDAVRLLGFEQSEATYVNDVLKGRERFRGRDARERIAHLLHIRRTLSGLFRDPTVENEWLRESHHLLDGRSPLTLLLGGSMEDLLLVRDYTDAAAGR